MAAIPVISRLRSLAGCAARRLGWPERPDEDRVITESLQAILGTGNPIVAVDVGGANDLQPHWKTFRNLADFIVYEPHPGSYQALVERKASIKGYERFRYVEEALSGKAEPRVLYQTNVPTGSSLLPPKKGGIGDYPGETYFWPVSTTTIQTTTLAESLDRERVARIDIIKLDTQGTELEILGGLDSRRFDDLLLVETEVSLLDFYEESEHGLENMLRFMHNKGFSLFDLRTNRFIGNAMRMDMQELKAILGDDLALPPNGHRLGEVDAVFARDPRYLLDVGADQARMRRLIVLLIAYFFLPEAVFATISARDRGVLEAADCDRILGAIRTIKFFFGRRTASVAEYVRKADGRAWAQYMWVPYPSA